MNEHVLTALIGGLAMIVTALINRGGSKRILLKLVGIERHLGIQTDDNGKVLVLRKPMQAAAEYQDERAK